MLSIDFKPKDIDKIVEHINNYFKNKPHLDVNYSSFAIFIDDKELKSFIEDVLMSCKEFMNLSLNIDYCVSKIVYLFQAMFTDNDILTGDIIINKIL